MRHGLEPPLCILTSVPLVSKVQINTNEHLAYSTINVIIADCTYAQNHNCTWPNLSLLL